MTTIEIGICIVLGALVIYWWLSNDDSDHNRYPDVI